MKMIPPTIDKDTPSGEKEVFQLLQSTSTTNFKDWIVFHSLNYPSKTKKNEKKSYNFFGESDFVIFVPSKGLINIEVKGGRISRQEGIWCTENRFGKHKIKDPFKQASKSLFHIGDFLEKKNILIPQDYLVVFPDCDFDIDTIEIPKENLVSGEINPLLLKKLTKIVNEHLLEAKGRFYPKQTEANKISNIIRPNFEVRVSSKNLLNQSRTQINQYTNEQIKILENYETKRLIVNGSQGTGKTVIAEEIAKRKLLNGSVLFISSGRLRNEETKYRFKDYNNFYCATFHSFIYKTANNICAKNDKVLNIDNINSLNFDERADLLLEFISNEILNFKDIKKYDCLILDEMQNYCHYKEFYGVFGSILKDDLKQGSWYFFGDFDYQNLWSKKKTDQLSQKNPKIYLNDIKPDFHNLSYNVRNAQQIAVHAPLLSGVADKKLPSRPFVIKIAGSIKHSFEKDQKSKIIRLEKIIEDLYNQNIHGSDIVILSSNRINHSKNILGLSNISKFYKTVDLTQINTFGEQIIKPDDKKSIYFSTIHGFQGMESKIVILLDPLTNPAEDSYENIAEYTYGKEPKNLITYNAMGRANTLLYVIWYKIHEKYVSQQIGKALKIQDEITK